MLRTAEFAPFVVFIASPTVATFNEVKFIGANFEVHVNADWSLPYVLPGLEGYENR